MTEQICKLLDKFLSDPVGQKDALVADLDQFLKHLDGCSECATRLDDPQILDSFLGSLFEKSPAMTSEESREIDELVRLDREREDQIRSAVRELLIPALDEKEAQIAARHEPLLLYSALEAVSSLLYRHVAGENPEAHLIQLDAEGSVYINNLQAIPSAGVALEIARFTDMWEYAELEGEPRKPSGPSAEAHELARWVFRAAREQRNLLRHFRVDGPWMQHDRITLLRLRAEERSTDLSVRWKPSHEVLPTLFIAGAKSVEGLEIGHDAELLEIYSVPLSRIQPKCADLLGLFMSNRGPLAALGAACQWPTAFVASAALSNRLSRADQGQAIGRKLALSDGFIVSANYVGRCADVSFLGDKVRLTLPDPVAHREIVQATGERVTFMAPTRAVEK